MEVYLVGGAVRDERLNLQVIERDYAVVGSTPEAMLKLGYRQVGRDFPVFLHPETAEEYALARTERKVGPGHTGFEVHAGPEVTLADDLRRRDLTINAMAVGADGTLIDPCGGGADLDARLLRHVSDAFSEDPLRVLRVARFAARFAPLGFTVAPETLGLMTQMAQAGALEELAAERVFGELVKALATDNPGVFFRVLERCEALDYWFEGLADGPLDAWLELLGKVAVVLPALEDRYATLGWLVDGFGVRLKAPRSYQRKLDAIAGPGRELPAWQNALPENVLRTIKRLEGFRQPRFFAEALNLVECCARIDLQAVATLVDRLNAIDVATLRGQGLDGGELGKALDDERRRLIELAQRH